MVYSRPVGAYTGTTGSNKTKYQTDSAASTAISSQKVDGDFNYIIDALNELDTNSLPDQSTHSGKFLTTNGSVASWSLVGTSGIASSAITTDKIADGSVTAAKLASGAGSASPTGAVSPYAGSSAPTGWLLCYGQAVSRTTYADLFAVVSTTYGSGDGSTTFNVPDLRGRSVFGVDNMGGSAASRVTSGVSGITGTTLGAAGGNEAMHQHTHSVTDSGHTHGYHEKVRVEGAGGGGGGYFAATGTSQTTASSTTGISIQNSGTGSSQNMPPAIMLNWIIKT